MEPAVAAVVLVLLRPFPVPWLVAAALVGLRAAAAFLRRPAAREKPGTDAEGRGPHSGGNS